MPGLALCTEGSLVAKESLPSRPEEDDGASRAARLLEGLHRVGVAFEQGGVVGMASAMTALLVDEAGCCYAELTRGGGAEQRLAVAGVEAGVARHRWLLLEASEPLYLSVDGSPAECAEAGRIIRSVQPWLRALSSSSPRLAVERRLEALGARWRLSKQQRRVLRWLGLGLSNKEIAQRLGCSVKTIEAHVSQLLRRSDHRSRGDLLHTVWSGDEREN